MINFVVTPADVLRCGFIIFSLLFIGAMYIAQEMRRRRK